MEWGLPGVGPPPALSPPNKTCRFGRLAVHGTNKNANASCPGSLEAHVPEPPRVPTPEHPACQPASPSLSTIKSQNQSRVQGA
eukprot:scaffold201042_cov23-Prasinocladus_malaysianus.AAC.1